jgi:hypothetical protein
MGYNVVQSVDSQPKSLRLKNKRDSLRYIPDDRTLSTGIYPFESLLGPRLS